MSIHEKDRAHAEAVAFGIVQDDEVAPWTMLETGRYQPRRIKGSYRGRELG
jgi:hypothetical protein